MSIKVRFFASLAEIVSRRELMIDSPQSPSPLTVEKLYAQLVSEYPELARYERNLMFAVNGELAGLDTEISDGDEVAFLPPVSGGA